jgi:DNA (cytosine-5)-methyltransferase 1
MSNRQYVNHLDLFSGIGGFSIAAGLAGFTTVGFSEINDYCSRVLARHYPHVPNYGDIKLLSATSIPERITLMTGGFPCQPFSQAGQQRGVLDDRHLWPHYMRLIRECEPRWVVAENVNGIVAMELDNILTDLENENYETAVFNIPAIAACAPHQRKRIWIVAHANRFRCEDGWYFRKERDLFHHFQQYITAAQGEWSHLQYESWQTFNFHEWFTRHSLANIDRLASKQADTSAEAFCASGNTRQRHSRCDASLHDRETDEPPLPGMDDGVSTRLDPIVIERNRALGNAIVPAVVYPLLKIIYEIEKHTYAD